jgi:hypothetical protein
MLHILTAQRYRTEILDQFIDQLHDDEIYNSSFQQDEATPHWRIF